MTKQPEKHRRSIRFRDFDYSQPGAYFVTICTQNKASYFDQKPELKQVIIKHWKELPHRYPYITLDEFVVMPNHVHGIICITENVGVIHELPLQDRL